ncbi:MAG: pyruvate, phosphate dikinase [Candidatus Riflebacteria bacterium]|nr:pyruvate, phosphate dikinase [Candidatus Riflebacteria bacterium]
MRRQELTEIFRRHKTDQEIFHDLMPHRTREILLVAPLYEAFTIEQDGLLSEIVFGEYTQLNLPLAPRVTSVSSREEAVQRLKLRHFDQVIIMSNPTRQNSVEICKAIRAAAPTLPISLLMSDNAELVGVSQNPEFRRHFDQIFVWNGHSEIFLAMVKCIEDRLNVDNDTRLGGVRVILLAESSIRSYSSHLPLVFSEIVKQTQRLIGEEHLNGVKKILRMRARTKVLLATSFAEAVSLTEAYRDNLLAVFTDLQLAGGPTGQEPSGLRLARELRATRPTLPILLLSSSPDAPRLAEELGATCLNTLSETSGKELANFFSTNLGFGDFIFRNARGEEIARARSLEDLTSQVRVIPAESLVYHATRHHFSSWLMARGEILTAQMVFRMKVDDFQNPEGLRSYLLSMGKVLQEEHNRGKVVPFENCGFGPEHTIARLAGGSLGGKGRGIAFLNSLLGNSNLGSRIPEIMIRIPQTAIIGIDEFTRFLETNRLQSVVATAQDEATVKRRFLAGKISPQLEEKLRAYLDKARYPLAVRSSGLLEDSVSHPLSGLYQTFFLPNNHPDPAVRLDQLTEAIKLVYASAHSPSAHAYFDAIQYKIEEERMAVIIQQLVGTDYGTRFYPHLSGVAQSYNFYPYSYIEPSDGAGLAAVGLGRYVVGGERSFRFCPAYPHLELAAPEDMVKDTQTHFYALDLAPRPIDLFKGEDMTLLTLGLPEAEADGALTYSASVWNHADQRLEAGLHRAGPRVINFAYLLKYQKYPLAQAIQEVLDVARLAMESPVEVEFAVNLQDPAANGGPCFYLLQVKHLLREQKDCTIELGDTEAADIFLLTHHGMGNGVVDDVTDVVWVDPERFNRARTEEMAREVERINGALKAARRKCLLLGPGRWGTRDRWLGIPINWPQISQARVIVEYALEDFQVDPSLGSHFFHNVTSMNIGYFTVPYGDPPNRIDWTWLRGQPIQDRGEYFVHTALETPLKVVMDGRKSLSVILKNGTPTI